jgi:hypothetical protein
MQSDRTGLGTYIFLCSFRFRLEHFWRPFAKVFSRFVLKFPLELLPASWDIGRSPLDLSIYLITGPHHSHELNGISLFLLPTSCLAPFCNSVSQPSITGSLLANLILPFSSVLVPHCFQSGDFETLSPLVLFFHCLYFRPDPVSQKFEKLGDFGSFLLPRILPFPRIFPILLHSPPFFTFISLCISSLTSSLLRYPVSFPRRSHSKYDFLDATDRCHHIWTDNP